MLIFADLESFQTPEVWILADLNTSLPLSPWQIKKRGEGRKSPWTNL